MEQAQVNTKAKSSKKKIAAIVASIIAVLLIAGDWMASAMVYDENFNQRFESYEPLKRSVDDFDGLRRTRYQFSSDKGQKLTGYLYSSGEDQHGIIVMAHGFGGGGHNSYMDFANYFAHHGYYVFAYDATGNDESEGDGVGGLPQGVADLDYAISFVRDSGHFPNLPMVLFGHSWGAYSVSNVLTYHPEVKAVIACSGFNASSDLFASEGKKQAGNAIYAMMPFVRLHEWHRFGKYASNTALDGFSKSNAAVMIVHSFDDEIVPAEYGYETYLKRYRDDPRFTFVSFEDQGHDDYFQGAYADAFNSEFDQWRASLDYDPNDPANKERFAKDKAAYIHTNLDRKQWSNSLNDDLFKHFVDFYDSHTA